MEELAKTVSLNLIDPETPMRLTLAALTMTLITSCANAGDISPRQGWVIHETKKSHAALLDDLKAAVKANKMGVVTQAGPTGAAANRGIKIPENRVVGVFSNDFAVKILALSTAAMIEAPVRFYVTEEKNGFATLSYKTPSHVFEPYVRDAGPELQTLAANLDTRFAAIARSAIE